MGRPSRFSRDIPLVDNYRIYVPFRAKNSISTFIDCYTPSTNSWHRATSIPQYCTQNLVLRDFAMVSIGHYIYIIGGRLCRQAGVEPSGTDSRIVPFVCKYNVRTDKWDMCQPMTTPRSEFTCTVSNNKIYAAGGKSTLGEAKGISLAEVYDPALDQWRSLAPMNTMRYKSVALTWQGKVHIMGGFVDGGENQGPYVTLRSSAEVYDVERDKWDFKARMWALDVPPCQIIVANGKMVSCGDCLQPWKGHLEAYEEKENIWDVVTGSRFRLAPPVTAVDDVNGHQRMQRVYLTMASIGNKLYLLTGHKIMSGDQGMRTQVHVFDTALNGDGWESLEPIDEELGEKEFCGHGCVVRYD